MDEEVNATQAAALIGVSERTIRRRIAAGQLVARRVAPNRFAIAVSDLPKGRGMDALVGRFDAIEQRVKILEARLQSFTAGADHAPIAEARLPETAPVASLRDLVAQLTQELERLSPVLATDVVNHDGADSGERWYGELNGQQRSRAQNKRRAAQ